MAGAALDVYAKEPTVESPLFEFDRWSPPRIWAPAPLRRRTRPACRRRTGGARLGRRVRPLRRQRGRRGSAEAVRPWLPLAERLGRFWAALARELPSTLDVGYQGGLADHDTRILSLAVIKGMFAVATDEPVSYVNAPQLADERGLVVRSTTASAAARSGYANLVGLRGGGRAVAGTMFGDGEPRVVMVDDHDIELPWPAGC